MDSQDMEKKESVADKAASTISSFKNNYDVGKLLSKEEGSVLLKMFSFSGRLDRLPYILRMTALWLAVVVVIVIIAILTMGSSVGALLLGGMPRGGGALMGLGAILIIIIFLAALVSYISLAWRRLHDMGKTGLIALIIPACIILTVIIPSISFIFNIVLFVFSIWLLISRGTYGENTYGKDILLERSQKYVGKSETSVFS